MKIYVSVINGEDNDLEFFIKTKEGEAVPLDDVTAIVFTVRKCKTDAAKITKTLGDGITILNELAGRILVTLTDTDLSYDNITPGKYEAQIRLTDNGSRTSIARDFDDEPIEFTVKGNLEDN